MPEYRLDPFWSSVLRAWKSAGLWCNQWCTYIMKGPHALLVILYSAYDKHAPVITYAQNDSR